MKRTQRILATSLLCFLCVGASLAQKIGDRSSTLVKHAAVITTFFRNDQPSDNEKAMNSVRDEITSVLSKSGIEEVSQAQVNAAWIKVLGQSFDETTVNMPRAEDLVAIGKQLGVDYVLFARTKWHVKSVWVTLGPKTKADATVDLWVINPVSSEFVSRQPDIHSDDTGKEAALGIALDVFVAPVTFVSGGPETPHMQRAGQLAMIKALAPWVKSMQASSNKIGK